MKRIVFGVFSTLALTSCASEVVEPPQDYVQQQWTKGIARLGRSLTPVYPPSEDFQVGDVYAVGSSKDFDKIPADVLPSLTTAVKLGTSPSAISDIYKTYKDRIKLPVSKIDGTGSTATIKINEEMVAASPDKEKRAPQQLTPVPILALPSFTIASGTLDKFGVSFATNAFGVLFGGSSQKDVLLSVKIDEGETYGLDVITADHSLNKFCATGNCASFKAIDWLNRSAAHNDGLLFDDSSVLIIKRVYMTRKIDYQFTFSSAQAFMAATTSVDATATAAAQTASVEQAALGKIIEATTPPATASAGAQVNNQVMVALVNDLGTNLSKLAGAGPAGAFFASSSYSNNSVTLSHIFPRPVVFAYDALWWNEKPGSNPKPTPRPNPNLPLRLVLPPGQEILPPSSNPQLPLTLHPKTM